VIAHIAGVPVEEVLTPLVSVGGAGVLLARTWLNRHPLRRRAGDNEAVVAGGFVSVPPGVPHAYLVTSDIARTLVLLTPGTGAMESFFRAAGEPAAELVLPPERPLDIERIAAAAERTGAVKILGPPPFDDPTP